jgi:hypothetical protein
VTTGATLVEKICRAVAVNQNVIAAYIYDYVNNRGCRKSPRGEDVPKIADYLAALLFSTTLRPRVPGVNFASAKSGAYKGTAYESVTFHFDDMFNEPDRLYVVGKLDKGSEAVAFIMVVVSEA